jgi:hypothetical protein
MFSREQVDLLFGILCRSFFLTGNTSTFYQLLKHLDDFLNSVRIIESRNETDVILEKLERIIDDASGVTEKIDYLRRQQDDDTRVCWTTGTKAGHSKK